MKSEADQFSDLDGTALQASAPERQARMLEHLRSELFVDVQVLREKLGVSIATIRRDLTELESRGLLKRTHGGAVVINQVTRDNITPVREITHAPEKQRIGTAAASMVVEGDAVMIDSGTTSLQVARRLAANASLTFVTNGSDTISTLVSGGAKNVHVIGGQYIDINRSFSGTMAADMVRRFSVDKAILSVSAIDLNRGLICTLSPEIGCVQQAMIEIAQTVIVVADHSKFGRSALSAIAPLDRVDYIVTNEETQENLRPLPEKIRKKFVFA
ncbi:DeoR/GlpR family DNA-binding transcription regulator [Microvirga pudoricolor]|uniref:DeoR/GlpR family DNA-binding transcription regulator n=1 Tax=Microvirga pudoricolor TaxID=2778729 RepID=UPI0019515BBF|nr:DeoR/GlpR family DNA-binding transcription regulator [Microvirga pudoricolor]MBM6592996.1 DeoR/GlpR transcriptional regulator [Microvirga pudoricolor]